MIVAMSCSPTNDFYCVNFFHKDDNRTDYSNMLVQIPCESLNHAFAVAEAFNNPEAAKAVQDAIKVHRLNKAMEENS